MVWIANYVRCNMAWFSKARVIGHNLARMANYVHNTMAYRWGSRMFSSLIKRLACQMETRDYAQANLQQQEWTFKMLNVRQRQHISDPNPKRRSTAFVAR